MTKSWALLNDLLSFFEQQEDGSWELAGIKIEDDDLNYSLTEACDFTNAVEESVFDEYGMGIEDS